jgi:hypothetical protein
MKIYILIYQCLFSALAIGAIISSFYVYNNNLSFFGYIFFEKTKALWGSGVFLGKFISILIVTFEALWIVLISPAIVIINYFKLSSFWGEVFLIANCCTVVLLGYIQEILGLSHNEKIATTSNLKSLNIRPIFNEKYKFNVKINLCFYVGPFSDNFTLIYKIYICSALKNLGLKVNRSDEIFGIRPVIEDIWEHINEASLIIADISGNNPNVMYEVGIASTLEKRVIIITQNMEDIPNSMKVYKYILYDNSKVGLVQLGRKLKSVVRIEIGNVIMLN